MPAFPKPKVKYDYQVEHELRALRAHARDRGVPRRRQDRLLLATWNIANLGVQQRREEDYRLLGEICRWFDLVAVQEVNDDLEGLDALRGQLPKHYCALFSEASGNQERAAFLYDERKLQPLEKVGRLSIPPSQLKRIKLPGVRQSFKGFDRGPYLAAFQARSFRFLLLNVHLYYGSESTKDIERRSLETYAVAYWADHRRKSKHAFTKDIVCLGDFNLPMLDPADPIFKALTAHGLALRKPHLRDHLSVIGGTSLGGRKHYDQVAVFPGETRELEAIDVFDYDNAIFRDLWLSTRHTDKQFAAYCRYYISDHRPLWAEFRI